MSFDLPVHLSDERKGRIYVGQSAPFGFPPDRLGDPMSREDDRRAIRNRVELVNEDRALCSELPDNMRVMNNLMPHEDRRAKPCQGFLDGSDRPFDPGAKPARPDQKNSELSH
jgi:hypothetical protein